jgi:hypothetical protein
MGLFKKFLDSNYKGEFKNGKRDGEGTYTDPISGSIYIGGWAGGKKNGFGKLTYPGGGLTFEGWWEEDIFYRGKEVSWLGDTRIEREGYFEEIEDNMVLSGPGEEEVERASNAHVHGRWVNKYVGEFKKGEKNGYGSEISYVRNPIRYDRGKKINEAQNSLNHGSAYVGEWKDNKRSGYGVYTLHPAKWIKEDAGDQYRSDYSSGSGIFFEKRSLIWYQVSYSGQWKNGERNGKGTQTYQDGSTYNGEWLNDMKHGEGTFISEWNDKLVGPWVEDCFLPKKEEIDQD